MSQSEVEAIGSEPVDYAPDYAPEPDLGDARLADPTHELKSDLTVILGGIDLLIADEASDEQRRWAMQAIRRSAVRLAAAADHDWASLQHAAYHDQLTNLPNRRLTLDRLEGALARAGRAGTAVGVLFVDLNGFKAVNDRYGHNVGDQVLRVVAGRLRRSVRPGDTVSRHGGDEFVIVCEGLAEADSLEVVAERVAESLSRAVEVGGREHRIAATIGRAVAVFGETTPEALVESADRDMYLRRRRR